MEIKSIDSLITDLYTVAKHYGYRDLHDKMIRDSIIVGIRDSQLS